MRLFNSSRPVFFLGLLLAVPLLTGANGNGCGPGQVVIGNDTGGGDSGTGGHSVICNCPALPAVAELCPDGTSVSATCGVTGADTCGVVFPPCPTGSCTVAECGALPPTPECANGTTVSPVCVRDPSNVCGWSIPSCPTQQCSPGDCGPEPAIVVDCGGTEVGPQCVPTEPSGCSWIVPPCLPPVALDGGAAPMGKDAGT